MASRKKEKSFLNFLLEKLADIADVLTEQDLLRVSQIFSKPRLKKNSSSFLAKFEEPSTQDFSERYQHNITNKKSNTRKGSQDFEQDKCNCKKSRKRYNYENLMQYFQLKVAQFKSTTIYLRLLFSQITQLETFSLQEKVNDCVWSPITTFVQSAPEGIKKKETLEAIKDCKLYLETHENNLKQNRMWLQRLCQTIQYEVQIFDQKIIFAQKGLQYFKKMINLGFQTALKRKYSASEKRKQNRLQEFNSEEDKRSNPVTQSDLSQLQLRQINSVSSS